MTFYLILVIVLFFLAISDLVVGVSNDAVNFLNSAIGAKAAPFKVIMIVAALGILVGATFSSGMMEVARKGIFHPQYFYFSEIILLFLAVMVTDVILLDMFNTFGMPTSTTVSIVFELLGAAVAVSLIKILNDPNALGLGEYINSGKALAIISGILLSVVVAFSAGVIIQYLSRLVFSFDYEKNLKYFGAIFGGLSIAAITFFILIKGAKGSSIMTDEVKDFIKNNSFNIILASFVGWTVVLQLLKMFTKINILKLIVLVGTFALAMAFAGNDLVNFIGVPLAGYESYKSFAASGAGAEEFLMDGLSQKVATPTLFLLLAGAIMVLTLWTSKKAKSVVKTSLDLGRQDEGYERFAPSAFTRTVVRYFSAFAVGAQKVLPEGLRNKIENQFDQKPYLERERELGEEAPAFDMIRAAVTLVVASILISIGTSLKLPLSTTYVTFMVAMGTSLADGAWGRESAVYRISGVLSVVGGWFFTAFSAFTVAFILALLFSYGGIVAIIAMLFIAGFLVYRTHKMHGARVEDEAAKEIFGQENISKEVVLEKCSEFVTEIFNKVDKVSGNTLNALAKEDLNELILAQKDAKGILKRAKYLRGQINRIIDRIAEDSIESVHYHVLIMDYLVGISASTLDVTKASRVHVDNNHRPMVAVQIEELKTLRKQVKEWHDKIYYIVKTRDHSNNEEIPEGREDILKVIKGYRKNQIKRIKNREVGTRSSVLFLHTLAETRNQAFFGRRIVRIHEYFVNYVEGGEAEGITKE